MDLKIYSFRNLVGWFITILNSVAGTSLMTYMLVQNGANVDFKFVLDTILTFVSTLSLTGAVFLTTKYKGLNKINHKIMILGAVFGLSIIGQTFLESIGLIEGGSISPIPLNYVMCIICLIPIARGYMAYNDFKK